MWIPPTYLIPLIETRIGYVFFKWLLIKYAKQQEIYVLGEYFEQVTMCFNVWGDVDQDGQLTIQDIILIVNEILSF